MSHSRMRGPGRRNVLAGLGAAVTCVAVAKAAPTASRWPTQVPLGPVQRFDFTSLQRRARSLAARPWSPPPGPAPELVRAVDYNAFGQITYRPSATLWGDAQGDRGVRLFPQGRPAPIPVAIDVVSGGEARPVLYSPNLFEVPPDSPLERLGPAAGFGGFKVMNADHRTDWLAFLGASYFRSADPFNQYGLSARGLAVDTASARPESFPAFTAFWMDADPDGPFLIYALLDGPQVCGAYRIANTRSAAGLIQEIEADLYIRSPIDRLGIAPLTSMYWYGPSDRTPADDWRPQVHDSDGLAIWTGAGERIWRPLANPPRPITNAFTDRGPRGFGLMQRDRSFADYQDDGVFYERRPSVWVEPLDDWGPGAVELVELPTADETQDNIVAFWTPARAAAAGDALRLRYRLHWCAQEPTSSGVARVVATRFGRGGHPGQTIVSDQRKYVIDFEGGALSRLGRESGVEAMVNASPGRLSGIAAYPIAGMTGRWRLMFDLQAEPAVTCDLRAFLRRGGDALTETWIDQVIGAA
jgi:glucans biosynthesis protein